MKCPFVIKVCSKCKRILIANEINFHKKKNYKYGLRSECKVCEKEYMKKYSKQYYEERKEEKKRYREERTEEIKEYRKQYYQEHVEEIREKNEKYRNEHKEEIKEYYKNNKEERKEYAKQYREDNPEKVFNRDVRRRQRKENQGNGITKEQWLEMMNYFNWRCAYSGEYIGGKENNFIRSIDHITPLSLGGEHEIWNCVPMLRNYNSSKNVSDMLEWYRKQPYFSEERLNKIYEWIEYAYNKWGRE